MLPKYIIKDFIDQFSILDIKKANVQIRHSFYGNQKSNQCDICPFVDEDCIGFIKDDGERVYITFDELCEVGIDNEGCYLKSDVMELYIKYIFKK